jgi:hypothetical protein
MRLFEPRHRGVAGGRIWRGLRHPLRGGDARLVGQGRSVSTGTFSASAASWISVFSPSDPSLTTTHLQ